MRIAHSASNCAAKSRPACRALAPTHRHKPGCLLRAQRRMPGASASGQLGRRPRHEERVLRRDLRWAVVHQLCLEANRPANPRRMRVRTKRGKELLHHKSDLRKWMRPRSMRRLHMRPTARRLLGSSFRTAPVAAVLGAPLAPISAPPVPAAAAATAAGAGAGSTPPWWHAQPLHLQSCWKSRSPRPSSWVKKPRPT